MACRKICIIGVVVSILAVSVVPSWPHPHVFIDSAVDIVFDEKGLAGFRIRWLFDEMFSSMIRLDFDENRNQRFEPSEIENVKRGAFSNLKKFDYFTHVKINGKLFQVRFVTDFSAEITGGRLVYRFFVPCHVQAIGTFKEVRVSIYDQTFYSHVLLIRHQVTCENQEPYEIEHRIEENRAEAYYYGQIYPEEIILRFRRENG
jgi:ABC-type uncharacterized transport system substrate-binding protein